MKKVIIIFGALFLSSCMGHNFINDHPVNDTEGLLNVVIEIPAGTSEKWEVAKTNGKMAIEYINDKPRIVKYLPYPFNYGMVPRTVLSKDEGGDGDPLDAIVIGNSIKRGLVVSGKVLGVVKMLDRGERDDKIIVITKNSSLYNEVNDIKDLSQKFPGVLEIIKIWLKNYKGEGKIEIEGVGDVEEAEELINSASK